MSINSKNKSGTGPAVVGSGMLLLLLSGDALAQYRGTPGQRSACTPDVFRLCAEEIPDSGAITACLKRNRARLSTSCGAVFGVGQSDRGARARHGSED